MVGPFRTSTIDCHLLWIGYVTVTDEVPPLSTIPPELPEPVRWFRDAVRQPDQYCVLTGWPTKTASCDLVTGLGAAHIVPLAYKWY